MVIERSFKDGQGTVEINKRTMEKDRKVFTKAKIKSKQKDEASVAAKPPAEPLSVAPKSRFADAANRVRALVGSTGSPQVSSAVADEAGPLQAEGEEVMQQFNAQFEHFEDDAPACDICGSITVRNGNCHKCYNCGNSMGCS